MSDPQIDPNPNVAKSETTAIPPRPLRVWPGVVLVALQWLMWFVVPRFASEEIGMYALFGGVICGLLAVVWWLFFSRAPWLERIGIIAAVVVAVIATKRIVHPSIAGGMMG